MNNLDKNNSYQELLCAGKQALEQEQLETAEQQFLQAFQILEQEACHDITLAENLKDLAHAYMENSVCGKAEQAYQAALKVAQAVAKIEPEYTGFLTEYFDGLGKCFMAAHNYSGAKDMFRRSYLIDEQETKNNNSDELHLAYVNMASDLNNIANVYYMEGKYCEAEKLMKEALAIDLKHMQPFFAQQKEFYVGHPSCMIAVKDLHPLARICAGQGKNKEAEDFYQQALSIYKEHSTGEDPELAVLLNGYAEFLSNSQRHEEANNFFEQAESIRENSNK